MKARLNCWIVGALGLALGLTVALGLWNSAKPPTIEFVRFSPDLTEAIFEFRNDSARAWHYYGRAPDAPYLTRFSSEQVGGWYALEWVKTRGKMPGTYNLAPHSVQEFAAPVPPAPSEWLAVEVTTSRGRDSPVTRAFRDYLYRLGLGWLHPPPVLSQCRSREVSLARD